MAKTTVTITNSLGMHARPAMAFVDTATGYNSSIKVVKDGQEVDGKSIMHLMMLAATKGTQLDIIADGDDADAAVAGLKDLVDRKFDEE
ncbi:Phosphocarrier protein NPr [Poriferisphaera corsica]|uniref:Phosphocarrier protein NPr n=1 Tax=Poriferisphaera corsica TaxID=2528020 RepID=A0A517YRQ8_9BACT|nr:HPr family phosphocarrier protein [Poriferisphaera corsica]QDU32901.1 Phosphocarrier protein NPr [Poriferisphaera corsica]